MIAGPSNYRSKAQRMAERAQRMAERAQPRSIPLPATAEPAAAPELTSTPIAAAPEIPDVQTDAQLPITSGSELQSKAREIAFPTPAPTPNYAAMSPSQQLNAADASSPQLAPLQMMSPQAVISNLLQQIGRGAGQGLGRAQAIPGYLAQQLQGMFNPRVNQAQTRAPSSSIMEMINAMPMQDSADFQL
jgi:hypothetical protein